MHLNEEDIFKNVSLEVLNMNNGTNNVVNMKISYVNMVQIRLYNLTIQISTNILITILKILIIYIWVCNLNVCKLIALSYTHLFVR